MSESTEKRKADHIKICLDQLAQAKKVTSGFEDIHFIHKALPEINRQKIDLSTKFLGHRLSAPLIVGAMTGGTAEAARINSVIAESVENLQLGMGVGSQRVALEDQNLERTFAIARKKAPNAFLIANIGGVQLVHGYGVKEIKKIIEMIDADAVAIHLNALQEAIQPEGQTNFRGIIKKIGEITEAIDKPVIVKETGCGIALEEAKKLEAIGVKAIDVGGVGGTSFAAVEFFRTKGEKNRVQHLLGDAFWDWGIPTVTSIAEINQEVHIPIIASGGVRTGFDIAKALAINASLTSIARPVLRAAVCGVKETSNLLSFLLAELKNVMFLVGAKKVKDLATTPVVITGKTAEWLRLRGCDLESYARRGVP
jgi:isopentenyl-diphosphate delta-isomerase